jgi:hypothetical protein
VPELVDAHVVVLPVACPAARRRRLLALLALRRLRVVRHHAVVLDGVGHAEARAFPLARPREEVQPRDRAVVLGVEADAGQALRSRALPTLMRPRSWAMPARSAR